MIDETYYGIRIDVFLPKSPITPPFKTNGWKTQAEQDQIRQNLLEILDCKKRS